MNSRDNDPSPAGHKQSSSDSVEDRRLRDAWVPVSPRRHDAAFSRAVAQEVSERQSRLQKSMRSWVAGASLFAATTAVFAFVVFGGETTVDDAAHDGGALSASSATVASHWTIDLENAAEHFSEPAFASLSDDALRELAKSGDDIAPIDVTSLDIDAFSNDGAASDGTVGDDDATDEGDDDESAASVAEVVFAARDIAAETEDDFALESLFDDDADYGQDTLASLDVTTFDDDVLLAMNSIFER